MWLEEGLKGANKRNSCRDIEAGLGGGLESGNIGARQELESCKTG